jgi:hypothetical protein
MARDRSLVQAVELWLPQGEVMALSAGAYRSHHELAADSARRSFHFGEGLPGGVWASRQALLWKDLKGPFLRAELAAEAGIDGAVGFPLFDGTRVVAALTLLLTHHTEVPSCLEVWNVEEELGVLRYGSGYYAHVAEFERFSPYIQFQRGTGLPGLTWLSGQVQVMNDVRRSSSFIRAGLAERCGLAHGVGIPIYHNRSLMQVLTLFSAEQSSLISSVELYHPQGVELGAATLFDWSGRSASQGESVADAPGRALAQAVLASCAPALQQHKPGTEQQILLALPIHDKKGLKQILVMGL